jgi:hypothetical protein
MTNAIEPTAVRSVRAPQAKAADAATGADGGSDADTQAKVQEQQALAVRQQAFDEAASERAEFEREREVLEQLMLAQLKNEDAIVKKWIEMI